MTKTVMKGVVHGRTIELETESGLPDGQTVSVIVQAIAANESQAIFEAFKRSAGGWAGDDPQGLEQFREQTRRQRKVHRPEIS